MNEEVVVAIDAGTTGVRAFAVDGEGVPRAWSYREFPQYFPEPGWVEHDPDEIYDATVAVLREVAATLAADDRRVVALGITNQRETTVVWSRSTGRPLHRAIVWQDRRTAARCDELRADGAEPLVRRRTGLVLDPYFSATKLHWLLTEGGVADDGDLLFGTVDSWLLWKLTGGPGPGAVHATDPSNASRTLLFDLATLAWSDDLCELFGVPRSCLPEVLPNGGRFGTTDPAAAAGLRVPVSGMVGDQQAALFGQACFEPGMAKNTYGTGSFVLLNLGPQLPEPAEGLLTSVAWTLGSTTTYVMEGSIFVTGAAVQWLRDGIGVIASAEETGPLAESVDDTGGVYFVPAFTGLGSPYWDPYARRRDPRAHPGQRARRARAGHGRGDGVPDRRCRRRDDGRERRARRGAARRRWREPDGPVVPLPGRPARRARAAAGDPGDDCARRGVSRRPDRGPLGRPGGRGRGVARGSRVRAVDGRRRGRVPAGRLVPRGGAVARLGLTRALSRRASRPGPGGRPPRATRPASPRPGPWWRRCRRTRTRRACGSRT